MNAEEFNAVWMVFYDVAECAYAVMSGAEWMKRDREVWLRQQMPTRVLLEVAATESVAMERLKSICREKHSQAIAAESLAKQNLLPLRSDGLKARRGATERESGPEA